MKNQHHVIWSNRDLDYDDWKDDLEAEYRTYPTMSVML